MVLTSFQFVFFSVGSRLDPILAVRAPPLVVELDFPLTGGYAIHACNPQYNQDHDLPSTS